MKADKNYIPYRELINKFPVNKGDTLMVASDITRLAILAKRKEGAFDPNLLIQSIQEKLGEEGTLLIPAFNHDLRSGEAFDIRKTKPITGALSQVAFERDDFVRTKHPLHSFMVWGRKASFYEELNNKSSFAYDSPFAFLAEDNAKMWFVSTSVSQALTYTHYVEELEKVKYRKNKKLDILYTDKEGHVSENEFTIYAKKRGWNLDFSPLEELMKQTVLQEQFINGLKFQFLPLQDAFRVIQEDIRTNKARSIAYFSWKLFFKDMLKTYLYQLKLYSSTKEKIRHAGYIQ